MQVTRLVEVGRRAIECQVDLEDRDLYMEVTAVWQGRRNIMSRVSEQQLVKIELSVTSNEYYEWARRHKRLAEIDSFINEGE